MKESLSGTDCEILVALCLIGMAPVKEHMQFLTSFKSQGENEHENKTNDSLDPIRNFCNDPGG